MAPGLIERTGADGHGPTNHAAALYDLVARLDLGGLTVVGTGSYAADCSSRRPP